MPKYSLIDDGHGNYPAGYETHDEQEKLPEPDQRSPRCGRSCATWS